VVGVRGVTLVPKPDDVGEAGVPESVVELAHGPVTIVVRVDTVISSHQRHHAHVGCKKVNVKTFFSQGQRKVAAAGILAVNGQGQAYFFSLRSKKNNCCITLFVFMVAETLTAFYNIDFQFVLES
jgi:hypothetical protein